MPRLYLIRHGRAAAGFGEDHDPGLDDQGRADAAAVADALAGRGPLPILVSPLRRTMETAGPLASRWGIEAQVEPAVAEIPSPTTDLAEREAWLRTALAGSWSTLGEEQRAWRDRLLQVLLALDRDTAVVTHFVAINAVLGHAAGADELVRAVVGNGSCTIVEHDGRRFTVVEVGSRAASTLW